jgi:hypothetical protein
MYYKIVTFSNKTALIGLLMMAIHFTAAAQEATIISSTINGKGQIELEVASTVDQYFILKVEHDVDQVATFTTSMTRGQAGSTIITEPLEASSVDSYQVLVYDNDTPFDTDGDGIDDITEYDNLPLRSPLNAARSVDRADGLVSIDSFTTFKEMSVVFDQVVFSEFLNERAFVKFLITDFNSDKPEVYFINSNSFSLHSQFADAFGLESNGDNIKKGQVIFHPTAISAGGSLGTFAFNYSNGKGQNFDVVQKTHELLAANMPFLNNNLSHFITELNEDEYERDFELYESSRVPVVFEETLFGDLDYWGLNPAEGFGFFRDISLEEIPDIKDIVLYESLPNALPRVSGIMTSAIQTPLSHVNLRAIQQNIPNAYIREPLEIDSIADLLGKNIYYKVEQDRYTIREASQEEVNNWFEALRPTEPQTPPLNLNQKDILPLSDISFDMSDAFGAKCSNIATMLEFGFPVNTTPDGFGVPFYFYQEFMKYNGFFDEIRELISDQDFIDNRDVRDDVLKDFRKTIKAADMPVWMLDALDEMHKSFPEGTSVRCRSSTNNEDLPGFNGAGLYDSKTQHPHEGHMSKSIKQVYASLWNLRAFDEREFSRVDHFTASMGVLCHPNYEDEIANGVGVSVDPLYGSDNTFYLNSQLGEDLITNPEAQSTPEEMLLDRERINDNDYVLVQRSNLVDQDSIILGESFRADMREFFNIIHDEFAVLYNAVDNPTFAMDIEYKITEEFQLIIKQARPWTSFDVNYKEEEVIENVSLPELSLYPNPSSDFVTLVCEDCPSLDIAIYDIMGRRLQSSRIGTAQGNTIRFDISQWADGMYLMQVFSENEEVIATHQFVKQ